MADGKLLNYPLSEAKAETVDGVRSQEAIEVTKPKENVVDTITVDEVKGIAENVASKIEIPSSIKFELIADLGNIHVSEEESVYIAYLSKEFELPEYDLYIFAMNGSFIITPLTTKANNTRLALSCGSFAYDESGNTMVARVRFIATYNGDPSSFRIGFDANFAEALYGSGITPKGYIFGIKL